MKINKFLRNLKNEVDNDLIKLIKNNGLVIILISTLFFIIIRYLVLKFGNNNEVSSFYFYSFMAILISLVWYISEKQNKSEIKQLLVWSASIIGVIIVLLSFVLLMYGVFESIVRFVKGFYN